MYNIFFMPQTEKKVFEADVEENKTLAAMSYLWILCLVPLFFKKESKFVQFHAKQGFVLFIVEVIISLIIWIPVIGQILFLAAIIVAAIGLIKAYNGEWWEAPLIFKWTKKINF